MNTFFRLTILIAMLTVLTSPVNAFAWGETVCSKDGYTVLTINGMLTDEDGAIKNLFALVKKMPARSNSETISFNYLYNPTHFDGKLDFLDVAVQKLWEGDNLNDHDLGSMLLDASQKVKTQKVLIVPHSQGNFYANRMYENLKDALGGIPRASLAIYGVASPASYVAGGGRYITSDTDSVIVGKVRDLLHQKILDPNAHIVFDKNVSDNGHGFAEVYLQYEAERIVKEIDLSLSQLKTNSVQSEDRPCITAPDLGFIYSAQGIVLGVGDYAATKVHTVTSGALSISATVGKFGANTISGGLSFLQSGIQSVGLFTGKAVFVVGDTISGAEKSVGLDIGHGLYAVVDSVHESSVSLIAHAVDAGKLFVSTPGSQLASVSTSLGTPTTFQNPQPPILLETTPPAKEPSATKAVFSSTVLPLATVPPQTKSLDQLTQELLKAKSVLEALSASLLAQNSPPHEEALLGTTVSHPSSVNSIGESDHQTAERIDLGTPQGSGMIPLSVVVDEPTVTSSSSDAQFDLDTMSPVKPVVLEPTLYDQSTTTVSFKGTGEASSTLLISWSIDSVSYVQLASVVRTGTSTEETWSMTLLLPEGQTQIVFALRDDAGNISSTTDILMNVTLPPPPPVNLSLSPGRVVLNEISYSSWNPYVELYNTTDHTVDLGNAQIISPNNWQVIPISGTIAPHSYKAFVSREMYPSLPGYGDIFPVWFPTTGETIQLTTEDGMIIDELPYCENWCDRGNEYNIIERFSPTRETADYSGNWGAPISYLLADGAQGTPGTRNTLNYLLVMGDVLTGDVSLPANLYVVNNNTVTVEASSSLTLAGGTTLKFYGAAALVVAGGFTTNGTSTLPVVITTFNETDDYQHTPENNVDISASGTLNLSGTDLRHLSNGLVLDHSSTTLTDVSIQDSRAGIISSFGSTTSNNLSISNVTGPAIRSEGTDLALSSTTITHVRNTNGVEVIGGQLSASDLSITDVFPGSALIMDSASATIGHLEIDNAWSGGVDMYLTNATITDATIQNSSRAITVNGTSTLVIASSTISGNSVGFEVYGAGEVDGEGLNIIGNFNGVYAGKDADIEIHHSDIEGNTVGVTNTLDPLIGTNSVDVTENYWGSSDGPTLSGQSDGTNGDRITDKVTATPFLTSDPTLP